MFIVRRSLGASGTDDLAQQPLGLLLERQDVGTDRLQRAQRLRLVEIAREADLVAGLDAVRHVPGVGRVRQDLPAQEGVDAAFLEQRHLLSVSEISVWLELHDGRLPRERGLKQAAQRVGWRALLVNLPDHSWRVVCTLGSLPQRLYLLRRIRSLRINALQAQRTLDSHFPVSEGSIREDPRLLGLFELQKRVADARDVLVR